MEAIKEYSNGELTIVWKPRTCIHAATCVKMLPDVYKPKEKPWIQIENASTEQLMAQIDQCPSGALSYYKNGEKPSEKESGAETKVEVVKDGPLMVAGNLSVVDADGNATTKKRKTFFCRCGSSENKPYCDGQHSKVGFKG